MKHLLLINANPADTERLTAVGRGLSLEITAFSSSVEALRALQCVVIPDLIILDLHMPEIDGWRFSSILHDPDFPLATHHVPLLVTSRVFSGPGLDALAHALGANRIIPMPDTAENLAHAIQESLDHPDARHSPRALVVDDDPNILSLLTRELTRHGYTITPGSTTAEAIQHVKSESFDLCIIDHMLDSEESIEFMPGPIAAARDSHCVFVVITGVADPELAVRYSQIGFDAYVRKPFTFQYLMDIITRAHREKTWRKVEQWLDLKTRSLREAEERFRDLFENAPVGYHSLAPDGAITAMNATELRWLGYTADELVGRRTIFDIQTAASAARGRQLFAELTTHGSVHDVDLTLVRKDGSALPVRIDSVASRDEGGRVTSFRTIVRDVAESHRLEEHLRQAQKMEALGVLATGIAHNFNNLLTPIMANASELAERFDSRSEEREILNDILTASQRAAQLIRDISILSMDSPGQRQPVELGRILIAVADILRRSFGCRIQIDAGIHSDLPTIHGVSAQLQLALANVCTNACEAIGKDGAVEITLNPVTVSVTPISNTDRPQPASFLRVSIIDNGSGIPIAVRARIFDPFFTTRGLARHTGLGLSVASAIMKSHLGFIDFFSEEGDGSRFDLYFPTNPDTLPADYVVLASASVPGSEVRPAPASGRLAAPITILIVEDDASQLRMATRLLEKAGYRVVQSDDGIKAVDIVRRSITSTLIRERRPAHNEPLALVILDMILPGIPGEKVLQKIRAMSTTLPVIVTSGQDSNPRLSNWLKHGATDIMAKPFDSHTLLDAVQRALHTPGGNL